jgi:tripartite-type tricarboxylate transporter receptor subunit TctC
MQSWNALTAPRGTPPEVQRAIAEGVLRSADAPGLADRLRASGLVLATSAGPAETAALIAADAPRWAEMVRLSGARIE